jgi:TonB-linked SusC/RagA family outer membrane protein
MIDLSLRSRARFGWLAVFLIFLATWTYAQDRRVSGRVLSQQDQSPLPGASLVVPGTNVGTQTDANGAFALALPASAQRLTVSYIGYGTREVSIGNASVLTIELTPDDRTLNEVVVIGYGERSRRDLTSAISTVSSREISKSISPTPELALQGRATGVFVSTPGGSPLARPQVRIRGVSTFGNAEPLYVVDGIPLTEFGNGSDGAAGSLTADVRGSVNILSTINPNDIESISVLKDAAAAAIYGVRAANGVILITTKRGAKGTPRVEVSVSHSSQNVAKRFDMLNVQQYTALYQESFANNPNEARNLPNVFNPSSPDFKGNLPFVDWQEALIRRNAPISDYSVRLSGGNDATRYYVSGGYNQAQGPLRGDNLKRYSLAMNVETRLSKYLSTGVTFRMSYLDAVDETGLYGDLRYNAGAPAWQPIDDPNGLNGFAATITPTFTPNPAFTAPVTVPGSAFKAPVPPFNFASVFNYGPQTIANGFGRASVNDLTYGILRNLGTAFVQVEPLAGLKIKGTLSVDYTANRRLNWNDFDAYLFSQTPSNPYAIGDGTSKGEIIERNARNYNLVGEMSAQYGRSFGKHNVDVLVNAMNQRYTFNFVQAASTQNAFRQPEFRNITNVPPFASASSFRTLDVLQGYLGRLSYNYANKYYLDATIRRDGSSRFAPGYKWGTFPGVSAAWRLTEEAFMREIPFLNDLKVRGGWGQLGNQETRSFAYLSLISVTPDYALGSGDGNGVGSVVSGISLPDFPVEDLSWEVATTTNVGIDASLFANRLTATVEYYDRLTSGILQATALPASVGNQNQPILNIASVRNSGMEFNLNYNGKLGTDFSYSIGGNLTTVKNRVVSTFNDNPFGGEQGRIEVGRPIGFLWGYQLGGIFRSQAEIDAWKANTRDGNNNNNFQPGDLYFRDVQGAEPGSAPDGVVNASDRTFLGSTIPGYYYGINLGANWRGFDLSVLLQGVGDVFRYDRWRNDGEEMAGTGRNQWASVLNRWTPQNPDATMPRAVRSDPAQNNRFSDRWVEDASFLRLKNVQLGYSLPASLLQRAGFINGARVYVGGTNLLVLTKWTGLDPEDIDRNGNLVPPTRALTVGLTASF